MKKAKFHYPLLVVAIAAAVQAGRLEHESRRIDSEGAKKLHIELKFAAGELSLEPEDMPQAATLDMDYNPRRVSYEVDYEVSKEIGFLYIESHHRRHTDIDTDDNRLDLRLSTRYPMSLEMEIGACDGQIDLGGIPLEELDIELGAASGEVEFSQPNLRRLKELNIDAGASSLDMYDIGNANFEQFTFSGGVGSFDLDFRGEEYQGETRIDIDVGLGSADIVLPRYIPIRVETEGDNWLSSVDFHHDDLEEIDDGIYESPDFERAETRIILTLDVGLGAVDLFWKR
ncbi:MAG: toast rack family protein [Candidatus Zixiibacteriota bacterium]